MATEVPLISSYKRSFVGRRLFHTLTGVKLFPGSTPCYTWVIRALVWLAPGSFTLAASLTPGHPYSWLAGGNYTTVDKKNSYNIFNTALMIMYCHYSRIFSHHISPDSSAGVKLETVSWPWSRDEHYDH